MKTLTRNQDERKAKLVGNIIIAIVAIAGGIYVIKGIAMQVSHYWHFSF